MQVITTKVRAATNTSGTKIVARAARSQWTLAYDHELSTEANHQAAVIQLVAKLENAFGGWAGEWVSGQAVDGTNYWVNATWTVTTQRVIVGTNPAK